MKSTLWSWTLSKRSAIKVFVITVGIPLLQIIQGAIPGWNIDPTLKLAISTFITLSIQNYCTDGVKAAQEKIAVATAKAAKPKENIGDV